MDTTVILLLAIIAVLLCVIGYLLIIIFRKTKQFNTNANDATKHEETDEAEEVVSAEIENLRNIAKRCEEKLAPEHRNLVKILIEKEYPELPAILQIENLRISLKRDHKNQSMFDAHNMIYALNLARCGHTRSARHIPCLSEVKLILAYREIINVYLEELGLEQISDQYNYWFIDVPSNWTFKWKYYNWDLSQACDKLGGKISILTPEGIKKHQSLTNAKVILLLNGWFELFEEI